VTVNATRSWRRAALVAIVSTVVCGVVLEAASRWLAPAVSPFEREFPIELTRVPRPYTMFGGMPGARMTFGDRRAETLDARGYRGRSADVPRVPGEVRIFAVGGSTLFQGERSIPEMLEAELRRRGLEGATVFNYGVVSSVCGQDLARVVFEIVDRGPDLVVFYNGGNDLISPALYDPRPGYPFNFAVYENNPLLSRDLARYPALPLLAYGSNVARALFGPYFARRFVDLEGSRRSAGFGGAAWKEKIASLYVDRLVKAQRVSGAYGADFVAFFQPLVFFKPHLTPAEAEIARGSGGLAPLAAELRSIVRARLEQARDRFGLRAVDLSGLFEPERGEIFLDWIHTWPEGERRVALAMADSVDPVLRSRAAKARSLPQ
jgi:lysophospholipase L1-like esterase